MLKSQGSCSVVSLSWPPPPEFTHQCFQEVTKKVDLPSKTLVSSIIHKYFEIISILGPTRDIFYKVYSRNQLMWASIWIKKIVEERKRAQSIWKIILKHFFWNISTINPVLVYSKDLLLHAQSTSRSSFPTVVALLSFEKKSKSEMQVSGKFEKKTVKANHHQIGCEIKTCGRARRKTGRKQKT